MVLFAPSQISEFFRSLFNSCAIFSHHRDFFRKLFSPAAEAKESDAASAAGEVGIEGVSLYVEDSGGCNRV